MATALKPTRAAPITRTRPFAESSALLGNSEALARRASEEGYLFFRGLAPRDTVVRLRAEVLAQCARRGWLDPSSTPSRAIAAPDAATRATPDDLLWFQADAQRPPVFQELRSAPGIVSVLEAVFGATPVPGHGDVVRFAFPNDVGRTTAPHQDHFFTRRSTALWTVWIPLLDCPSTLGGLAVLPGSHLEGLRAHEGGEGDERFIILPPTAPWAGSGYRAGDVLCFNSLTVHGARPNVTRNRIRVSVDFRYQPPDPPA